MNAQSIGRTAAETNLSRRRRQSHRRDVAGVYSFRLDQRILFVSFECWRGPLTINIDGIFDCNPGESVRLSASRLIFSTIEVDLSAAKVWRPAAPEFIRPLTQQREALKQLAASVLNRTAPGGFRVLLPYLLDLPEKQTLSASEAALLARLKQLRESIHRQDFDQATTLIESLLGMGRGLTPSGDDVIIGLLLIAANEFAA